MPLDLVRGATEHYADAVYYDFTYRTRTDDIAYYQRVARQFGGPVLEIGGGSGRIATAIAKDGTDVTALDASRPMLKQGRARAREELPKAMEVAKTQAFTITSGSFSNAHRYTTSNSKKHADDGAITVTNGSFTATLDPQSVTTFVADGTP